jgi:hypothetical protein
LLHSLELALLHCLAHSFLLQIVQALLFFFLLTLEPFIQARTILLLLAQFVSPFRQFRRERFFRENQFTLPSLTITFLQPDVIIQFPKCGMQSSYSLFRENQVSSLIESVGLPSAYVLN